MGKGIQLNQRRSRLTPFLYSTLPEASSPRGPHGQQRPGVRTRQSPEPHHSARLKWAHVCPAQPDSRIIRWGQHRPLSASAWGPVPSTAPASPCGVRPGCRAAGWGDSTAQTVSGRGPQRRGDALRFAGTQWDPGLPGAGQTPTSLCPRDSRCHQELSLRGKVTELLPWVGRRLARGGLCPGPQTQFSLLRSQDSFVFRVWSLLALLSLLRSPRLRGPDNLGQGSSSPSSTGALTIGPWVGLG